MEFEKESVKIRATYKGKLYGTIEKYNKEWVFYPNFCDMTIEILESIQGELRRLSVEDQEG